MNQPDPLAEAERLAGCSTGNDGEACVENTVGLPGQDGSGAEETPTPDRVAPAVRSGAPRQDVAKPPARRRRKPAAARPRAGHPTGRQLVASVLLAVQAAEAFRRRTGRYGRGADYLRLAAAGEPRRNLAAGINRAVDLGLIRLELRPILSRIRRFFALKRPSTQGKTAEKQGL